MNDDESLFKSLRVGHMGLPLTVVEDRVPPPSRASRPLAGLLRGA